MIYRFSVRALQRDYSFPAAPPSDCLAWRNCSEEVDRVWMHHSDGSGIQTMRKQTQKKSHQSKFTSVLSVPVIFTTSPRETGQPWGRGGGGVGQKSQCANTHRWKQNTTFWQTQSHTGALLHTCMHIQAPPSPVCIAPKRGAASFSKPVFHHRGGQGDSALLIHILRCLLSHSLLFFSPALKEQTTWNIIAERMNQSVSALSRLSSKDEVFLGLFVILPYTEEPSRTALYVYCSLCTYVLGLCSRVGRGRGGLLWQHEVNQHSVHVAFHYELGQTAEDYSSAQIYNNRQTSPESAVTKTPAVCSCMEWHSNSSHRRDYLTYLGAWGGSNMIYF